jgi:methionine synthase II (cobalamin-independent)
MNRIPVTHAGSLIRPADLLSNLDSAVDNAAYQAALSKAVADTMMSRGQSYDEYRQWAQLRVEHPELVAQRLVRLANVVGRDRVQAGTDCGFAQGAFIRRVHEEIQWAKLSALAEGARLASAELWGV